MEARIAGPDDVAEVIRLAQLMFDTLGIVGDNPGWRAQAEARFRQGLDDGTVAAIVVDAPDDPRTLLASAAVSITQRLPTPMGDGRVAYVQWVATEPAWQRRGLARMVMVELAHWAQSQGAGMVDLHASPQGEALYAELGYAPSAHPELRLRVRA